MCALEPPCDQEQRWSHVEVVFGREFTWFWRHAVVARVAAQPEAIAEAFNNSYQIERFDFLRGAIVFEDDDFEWDDNKAAKNLADHGVSFDVAREAFDDAFACAWQDMREAYDDDRFNILGMVNGRLLFVAYTLRNSRTRIISARGATPYEKRKYHEENQS